LLLLAPKAFLRCHEGVRKEMDLVKEALRKGQRNLSEYEAKKLLQQYGIPVATEMLVADEEEALKVARMIGYPVVIKLCSPEVNHKTERRLVEMDIRSDQELLQAFERLRQKAPPEGGGFLIQELVKGSRELMIGMIRDPQFGPCVMFGLGGIFTEVLRDVTFRVAPVWKEDALEMLREIKSHKILGAIRGMKAVDLDVLSHCLIALGEMGLREKAVKEVDVNPLIVREGKPVAVDALVVLNSNSA
jgi:succinyl-CoA synthetase beta subunit